MRILFMILLAVTLPGCAYTAVSTGTYVLTGRSIADHSASLATGADCNTTSYIIGKQDWLCEQPREPGTTYNRNPY